MPLFFIDGKNISGDIASFSEEEARHIRRVLRLTRGDSLLAFDGEGNRYHLTIMDETVKSVIARVDQVEPFHDRKLVDVMLGVGIPKGDRFDYILQKTTELGVSEIVPFHSSRTIARVEPKKKKSRITRWRRIVLEAVKQCGSPRIPQIEDIYTFETALKRLSGCDRKIILYEETMDFTIKSILMEKEGANSVALLIGPEGGFSKEEVTRAKDHGFVPAGLGRNILRVETAAISAIAMIQYHFENL